MVIRIIINRKIYQFLILKKSFISDNTRYIKDLLDRFEDPRLVPNWANQGMIILDYLDMIAKVSNKSDDKKINHHLKKIYIYMNFIFIAD